MQITQTTIIQRPAEEVFAYISNAHNDPLWNPGTLECVPDREPGVGEQRRSVVKMMGRERQVTAEVTEFEPARKLAIRTTSGMPMPLRATMVCEPLNGGTKIRATFTVDLPLLLRPLSPLLAAMTRRQTGQSLRMLKQLLESPRRSAGGGG